MRASPWWYRWRGLMIGIIFAIGFYCGGLLPGPRDPSALPSYAWLGEKFGADGPAWVLAFATLCVAGCFAIRAWGSAYLGARVVWSANAKTDALLVDGPFRYVRNPLYLGNLLMAIGFGLLALPWGCAIIVIGNMLFLSRLIRYEGTGLRATYASAYDAYAAAVPALVPRLTPAMVPGSVTGRASIAQGLRSEIFSASCAIAMLLFLVAGERVLPVFVALLIAGWIAQSLATRTLS